MSSVMVTLHGQWAEDGGCRVVLVVPWFVLHPPTASDWPSVKGMAGQAAGQVAQVMVVDRVEVWGSLLLKVQTESGCPVAHVLGSPALLNQGICHSYEKQ